MSSLAHLFVNIFYRKPLEVEYMTIEKPP